MKKTLTTLFILPVLLTGCKTLEVAGEYMQSINNLMPTNTKVRGEYKAAMVAEHEVRFNFSKSINSDEVLDAALNNMKSHQTALSYREFYKPDTVNVPGSELQGYYLTGLVVHPWNNVPTQHTPGSFNPPVTGERKYVFEYRDGDKWNMEEYNSIGDFRVHQYEVIFDVDESPKSYNTYTFTLLPKMHYIGARNDIAVKQHFSSEQAYQDLKQRMDTLFDLSIVKTYQKKGESKLKNDDITAFANIQRRYSENLSTNSKSDSEKHGKVAIGESVVDFRLYPYKSASVMQYSLSVPYHYTPSKGKPKEFANKEFDRVLGKFMRVVNL